jgi:ribose 5-phosphate isomerase B
MKIVVGADHRGSEACGFVAQLVGELGHEVQVVGPCDGRSCDYPDMAYPAAKLVGTGQADRGILICGTGIGMCIVANKVRGVRAALAHDELGAQMSRLHNDANILCLSGDMLGVRIIERIVRLWIDTQFEAGRHARRVRKIAAIESGCDPATVDAEVNSIASDVA